MTKTPTQINIFRPETGHADPTQRAFRQAFLIIRQQSSAFWTQFEEKVEPFAIRDPQW